MKKTDEKMDLEKLLATVEHAGRDSRRQQQLSEMIDRMAAEEAAVNRRRVWYRWGIGISAAACIVLFVTSIIKFTATPLSSVQPAGPMIAEVKSDSISDSVNTVEIDNESRTKTVRKQSAPIVVAMAENAVLPVLDEEVEERVVDSDMLSRNDMPEQLLAENSDLEEEVRNAVETITQPIVSVGNDETVAPEQKKATKERRRLFQLRRAAPSKMDGTMLAFNLL